MKTFYNNGNSGAPLAPSTTGYFAISGWGGTTSPIYGTETYNETYFYTDGGTMSYMSVYASTNTISATSTVTFRKNGADGNQTISITASTTGLFQDTSNTDSISVGDRVCFKVVTGGSGTALNLSFMSLNFESVKNFRTYFGIGDYTSTGVTRYIGINGGTHETTEPQTESRIYIPGTFQKARCYVSANASSITSNVIFRKNNSDTSLNIAITGSTTGAFEDTSNTVTVVATDDINWSFVPGNGVTTLKYITVEFLNNSESFQTIAGVSLGNTIASAATRFVTPCGLISTRTTEAQANIPLDLKVRFNNIGCYIGSNATTSASTIDLRKNSASTALTMSITAGTTGNFEDTSHTADFVSTDVICIRIVNGGGGSLNLGGLNISGFQESLLLSNNENLTITENISELVTNNINVNDSVISIEDLVLNCIFLVSISDLINITENIISDSTIPGITVFDSISLAEFTSFTVIEDYFIDESLRIYPGVVIT